MASSHASRPALGPPPAPGRGAGARSGRPNGWLPAVLAVAVAVAAPGPARAQDEVPVVRTPPVLFEFVPAAPPEGLEDRSATVVLEITVEVDGTVSEARVVEPAGEGFDERALEAARQFVFAPARRDGVAVRARIRYAYTFEPVVAEVVEATEGAEGAEDGAEGDGEGEPVADAEAPSGEGEGEPAEGEGEASETDPEDEPSASLSVEAVAFVAPRDGTRRTLEREVLTTIPGTRGDALRVVELLPGVGRPSFGAGVLIVRGAAPGDSEVFLDGVSVPLLYHFGGLTSFYQSLLLDRIDFVPGNFSVRYGRRIGGILEVTPRDPRTDGYHAFADVNAIDVSLMVEGPIGENFSFALAGRRSWVDIVLGAIGSFGSGPSFVAAPVYWDYQAIATWRPNATDRVRILAYGSSDELRLLGLGGGNNPNLRGSFGISTQFHRLQLTWLHTEDAFEQEIMAAAGVTLLDFGIGDNLRLDSRFFPLVTRAEWRVPLAPNVRLVAGLDVQYTPLNLGFRGPQPTQSEGMPMMPGTSTVDFSTGDVTAYRPALYVESQTTLFDRWDVVVGVRADYFREIRRWGVDPRLTTRVRIVPELSVRAAGGLFTQPPEFSESATGLGNPDLGPVHAVHVGLGLDLNVPDASLSFTLDGFYKHIEDRVVGTVGSVPPFFVNGGLGRIYGLEVGARLEPGGPIPLFGFLSYTLMRSERLDRPGEDWRLFDFDQTHILSAALVWDIGAGWQAGATFRLVSGNPTTPVVGAVNDVTTGIYRPIYGAVNSERNPFFHRLDVRLQKRWDIRDFHLTLYIDVQNVYNATNREGVSYSYDYTQSSDIAGLPILPSLGIRGEI